MDKEETILELAWTMFTKQLAQFLAHHWPSQSTASVSSSLGCTETHGVSLLSLPFCNQPGWRREKLQAEADAAGRMLKEEEQTGLRQPRTGLQAQECGQE